MGGSSYWVGGWVDGQVGGGLVGGKVTPHDGTPRSLKLKHVSLLCINQIKAPQDIHSGISLSIRWAIS